MKTRPTMPPNQPPADQTTKQPRRWPLNLHQPASWLVIGLVLVLLVVIGVAADHHHKTNQASSNAAAASAQVTITSAGFIPKTVTISKGLAVTWTNQDTKAHQVAADPYPKNNSIAGFNSTDLLQPGDSYSFSFTKAGTYRVHDQLNPLTVTGTVVVR